jgi:hypothetical protein
MRSIYLVALLFSASAFARGYHAGSFNCSPDASHTSTWTISNLDAVPGAPFANYSAKANGVQDTDVRGLAVVEEIAGGTILGLKGMRGSEKFTLLFRNDGTITTGEIPCTENK